MIEREDGSFRDPSGFVFYSEGRVYRYVAGSNFEFYSNFVRGTLYRRLVEGGMMVATSIVPSAAAPGLEEITKDSVPEIFEHERIALLSFPCEWSVSMWVDAGILTLDIQEQLLEENLSLKDATPYNIQFHKGQLTFIDLCSVEKVSTTGVWIAYSQFCQSWLYPLLAFHHGLSDYRALFLTRLDGMTLKDAVSLMGLRPAWRHGVWLDYGIPALLSRSRRIAESASAGIELKDRPNSAQLQIATIRRLRNVIKKLRPYRPSSSWSTYSDSCSYDRHADTRKVEFVKEALEEPGLSAVLDIGCNTGRYAKLAAAKGLTTVAIDTDMDSIDILYRSAETEGHEIFPLCVDLTNPTPGFGWKNRERAPFLQRYGKRFDMVFSLALIHHLIVTAKIPLHEVVSLQAELTRKWLIVEYVGRQDRMFRQLLTYRTESYSFFTADYFTDCYAETFEVKQSVELKSEEQEMDRMLFLMTLAS